MDLVLHICMMLRILILGIVPANATEYCVTNNGAAAVDLSDHVDQAFINKMKNIGVQTIIRYYDHEDETLPGKTLRRKERDLIISNGFQIAVVFQHNNDKFSSFTPTGVNKMHGAHYCWLQRIYSPREAQSFSE